MENLIGFIKKHEKSIGFLLGWGILFIDLLVCNTREAYFDSGSYGLMADYFKNNGLISFWITERNEYTELFSIRGYAWPFILAVCKVLGMGTLVGCWLFHAAFLAGGLAFSLPEFISGLFSKRIGIFARILPVLFSVFFWNGLIKYPLTDIPSVVTVSWGLMLLTRMEEGRNVRDNAVIALFAGIFLGVSYYIRSGCLPAVAFAVLIIFLYKGKKKYLKKFIFILSMCIGVSIAAVPQVLINQSFNQKLSYKVPLFFNTDIAGMEYYYGFKELRYETNLSEKYPEIVMVSYDSVIDHILAKEDVAKEDVTLETILKLGVKYPLEFLGLYTAKFVNSIDPRYGNEVYIKNLNSRQYLIMVWNYSLWFFGMMGLGVELNKGKGKTVQWTNMTKFMSGYFLYILSFIVPALIHLAGTHIEARYFYPCYVLLYTYLGMLCSWREMWQFVKQRFITVAIAYIVIFGCLNSIWNFTFENFHYAQLLMEDGFRYEDTSRKKFMQNYSDDLKIEYDIWSLEQKDQTYLKLSGYIFALNKESENSNLTLVLSSEDRQYMYDIHLFRNPNTKHPYEKSKFSINKELVCLEEGDYSICFLLKNGTNSGIVLTNRVIEIKKSK